MIALYTILDFGFWNKTNWDEGLDAWKNTQL
jgi:hypothetical protein